MIKRQAVLVVGSLNMDLVASAERLPQKGETILGKNFATFPGGKGGNQAVAAGKLGANVSMVGCIGADSFADELLVSLTSNHVHTDFVRKVDCSTGTALITVDGAGANTIVVVSGANGECKPWDVDRSLENFAEPGILLIQNEIPLETVEYAIRTAKVRGWLVVFNPAPARQIQSSLMPLVDIIIPNETEISLLTDSPANTQEEIVAAANKLLDRGFKNVIVTMGDKGALFCNELGCQQVRAYQVVAVDTTAAGDAYTGALATSLAEGKTLLESMNFAAAAAGLSVTKQGAQPSLPYRTDVENFMKQQERRHEENWYLAPRN